MNPLFLNILLFLGGFVLLTGGAEFLVRGASRLALRLKIPAVVVGLTIVAFGTSLPELMVTLLANLAGGAAGDIAIGNVVGSNIANLALILGIVLILRTIQVERQMLFREFPIMLAATVLFIVMAWNGEISRLEGVILFIGIIVFTVYSYTSSRSLPAEEQSEVAEYVEEVLEAEPQTSMLILWRDIGFILIGLICLVVGANWLVDSAIFLARMFGVSELVIGLTLVAVGTSLPELATSVVAVLRKEGDIAVGNLVGSNIFNILAIIGISATVRALPAPLSMRTVDLPLMLVVAGLTMLLVLPKPHRMVRWHGAILLAVYAAYNVWLFTSGSVPAA